MFVSQISGSDEIDALVLEKLTDFFDSRRSRARAYGARFEALWAEAERSAMGGKKLRPRLAFETYRGMGGLSLGDIGLVATAVELLHTAFLLHDDVLDGDTTRRGTINLIGAFSDEAILDGTPAAEALEWANSAAILAGDLLIHSSQTLLSQLEASPKQRRRLTALIDNAVFVTAAGELADMAYGLGIDEPEWEAVLSMTKWKTAHYSFDLPLRAAAVLAGAAQPTIDALGRFALSVGTAFQLRDDLLGVVGDSAATGKSTSGDVRSGKKTALVAYALSTDRGDELAELMNAPTLTSAAVEHVRHILVASGAVSFVESLIARAVEEGKRALAAESRLPAALNSYLESIADHAGQRAS